MSFKSTIVVVEDVLKSRELYENILGCKVVDDFGIYNVGFEGGLALYKKSLFMELTDNLEMKNRSNSFVLYFEVENIEYTENRIKELGLRFIHNIREQPWGQKLFRFYDYDFCIIEMAENMDITIQKMIKLEMTVDEIANKTGYSKQRIERYFKK